MHKISIYLFYSEYSLLILAVNITYFSCLTQRTAGDCKCTNEGDEFQYIYIYILYLLN